MPRGHTRRLVPFCCAVATGFLLVGGCVEQTMTLKSDPPGAVVYLNDQELGRTPMTRDFTWYGDYPVEVRKDGYETLKTHRKVTAPWWNWVPFDLFSDLMPYAIRDRQVLKFTLRPTTEATTQPEALMERAESLKGQLQSSEHTRPATAPSRGKPAATQPAATQP